ncbi:hypothetical protein GCM10022397_12150 [Flavivirga jejuensis]
MSIGQDSSVESYIVDHLKVYYVEEPSSDQYRLLNPNEIISGELLFGNNPEMDIAQQLIREIFIPESGVDFQQQVIERLRSYNTPVALFIYFDKGSLDESSASANWTSCIENGHFTSCVTVEAGDEYAGIIHFGANQMNEDGFALAKNRVIALLENIHSTNAQVVRRIPIGKGMFTQNLRGAEPTARAFASRAKRNTINWIAFQGANQDGQGHNLNTKNANRTLTQEYIGAFKDSVSDAQVYVWGWPMANSPPDSIRTFVDQLIEKVEWVDGDGIILDIEGVAHDNDAVAWNIGDKSSEMRVLMDYTLAQAHERNLSVGVSSFGSSLHRFPHKQMSRADFGVPQLYAPANEIFEPRSSATVSARRRDYVQNGIQSWERLGFRNKIVVASGAITDANKTTAQFQALLDITEPHLPSPSIAWWQWNRRMSAEKWDIIRDLNLSGHTP